MSSSRALSRSSAASSTSSEAAMGAAGEDDGVSTDSTLVASSSEKENAKIRFEGVPAAMKEDQPTALRPKRSTLFYASPGFNAKSNQKPFAGSAAKRESVQALGTIAHLQEFYTRQGLAARHSPLSNRQLQPALGPAALAQADESDVLAAKLAQLRAGDDDETAPPIDALAALEGRAPRDVPTAEQRPVTESTWKGKAYPDVAKPVEADLKKLRQTMMLALDETCWQWDLHGEVAGASVAAAAAAATEPLDVTAPREVDVLELINATTQAIRAVRNYLFALPPMVAATDAQQVGAAAGNERSASGSLRRKPSATFKGQHGSVKAKDAFKRQSSFSGLPRPSVAGLPMQHFSSTTGAANGRGQVPASRAPQQLPFQTVKRLNVSSSVDSSRATTPSSPASAGPPSSSYRAAGIERRVASEQLQRRSSIEEEQAITPASAPRDPLVVVRASALEVLGMLRDLEEKNRVAVPSAKGTPAGRLLPSSSKASVRMLRGDYSESSFGVNDEQHGDEDDGEDDVAYRTDLTLANFGEQRSLVRGYLATVNTVMSELRPQRGGGSAKQVATGLVGAAQPLSPRLAILDLPATTEDDLPAWARGTLDSTTSINTNATWLPRLRLLIDDLLPNEAAISLGFSPTASPSATLHRLANGLLLCHAFNAALRTSARPWGFIDEGTVHDDVDEEDENDEGDEKSKSAANGEQQQEVNGQGAKKATSKSAAPGRWTFRRVENLRRFAAAVQLRYGSSGSSGCAVTPAVRAFDAVRVAKRGEEDEADTRWQTQLEGLVGAWLEAVVREVREVDGEEEGVGG